MPGYPRRISEGWGGLPSNLDAALSWPDGKIYFFKVIFLKMCHDAVIDDQFPSTLTFVITTFLFLFCCMQGSYYWRWRDNAIDPGYPKQIREGFAGIPDNIDAAFVWGGNDKTYFIKG